MWIVNNVNAYFSLKKYFMLIAVALIYRFLICI